MIPSRSKETRHPKAWTLDDALTSLFLTLHYELRFSKGEAAKVIGLDKTKTAELLDAARRRQLVRHYLRPPSNSYLAKGLAGLGLATKPKTIVTPSPHDAACNSIVAQAAARYVEDLLKTGSITRLAVGGGVTVGSVMSAIRPMRSLGKVSLYPLAGSLPRESWSPDSIIARFMGRCGHLAQADFYPPAISFRGDSVDTQALADKVSAAAAEADLFLLGTGHWDFGSTLWSMLKQLGLKPSDIARDSRLAGSCGFSGLSNEGEPVEWPLDHLIFKVSADDIRAASAHDRRHVVVVARGRTKAAAIRAVLVGGWCNCLVTDDQTAAAVLEAAGMPPGRRSWATRRWLSSRLQTRACSLHYLKGVNLKSTAVAVGASPGWVSQLVRSAEENNTANHDLNLPHNRILAGQIAALFPPAITGRRVIVTAGAGGQRTGARNLRRVAQAACRYFELVGSDGSIVTLDGGRTLEALIDELEPGLLHDLVLLPAAGGLPHNPANSPESLIERFLGRYGESANIQAKFYPLAHTRAGKRFESDEKAESIRDLAGRADIFLLGVGANKPGTTLWRIIKQMGFKPGRVLGKKVVATFGYIGIDERGKQVPWLSSSSLIMLPSEEIRVAAQDKGRHVIMAACGLGKVSAITAVIRGGWCNCLVTDEMTAKEVVKELAE